MTFRFMIDNYSLIATLLKPQGTILTAHGSFMANVEAARDLALVLAEEAATYGLDVVLVSNRTTKKPEHPSNLIVVSQHDHDDMNSGMWLGLRPYAVVFDNYGAVEKKLSFERVKEMAARSGLRVFRFIDAGMMRLHTPNAYINVGEGRAPSWD